MKKTVRFLSLLIGLILLVSHVASAAVTIDYTGGLKFNFEDTVIVNAHKYYVDTIEYKSETGGNGQYFLKAAVAIFGTKDVMSHYDDDIDTGNAGAIQTKLKNVSTGAYEPGELTVRSETGPDSDLKTGSSNEIAILSVESNAVNPGKYVIDTFVGGKIITSAQACLPSYTSSSGKIIGNETCGASIPPTPTPSATKTIDDVIGTNLQATAGAVAAIKPTAKDITYSTAKFSFLLTAGNRNVAIIIPVKLGTDTAQLTDHGVAFIENDISARDTRTFDYQFTGLAPDTVYYFQLVDSSQNVSYQRISFKTAPDPSTTNQNNSGEITATIDEQKAGITLILEEPTPKATTIGTYDVSFAGIIKSSENTKVRLQLYLGESSSLQDWATIMPETFIKGGTQKGFALTIHGRKPGTTYYYKIKDATHNFFPDDNVYSFTTDGTAPIGPKTFNPNDPGILTNYDFPTNIGEPTGTGAQVIDNPDPLVPCGKLSDQGNPEDKDCKFAHIIILAKNVINFMLILLVPAVVLLCVYTGVQMIIQRKNPVDLGKYKDRFIKIGWGVGIMILAWTIVATVLKTLVNTDAAQFILLKLF